MHGDWGKWRHGDWWRVRGARLWSSDPCSDLWCSAAASRPDPGNEQSAELGLRERRSRGVDHDCRYRHRGRRARRRCLRVHAMLEVVPGEYRCHAHGEPVCRRRLRRLDGLPQRRKRGLHAHLDRGCVRDGDLHGRAQNPDRSAHRFGRWRGHLDTCRHRLPGHRLLRELCPRHPDLADAASQPRVDIHRVVVRL